MIKQGDRVYIKPEWQDAGDESIEFIAVEILDSQENKILVSDRNSTMYIVPTFLLTGKMIDFDRM